MSSKKHHPRNRKWEYDEVDDTVPTKHQRYDQEEALPFYDEYNDPRFKSINMTDALSLLNTFEMDSDIQTFSRAAMDHILSGGVLIDRKGWTTSQDAREWHTKVYSQWMRDVFKHEFCLGFAICVVKPRGEYGGEPRLLNLAQVEIKVFVDYMNEPHFRVWQILEPQLVPVYSSNVSMGRRRIHNIKVFCSSPPSKDGRIRSQLQTLLPDLAYEHHLLFAAMVADEARAQPPIVTQRIPEPYKDVAGTALTMAGKSAMTSVTGLRLGDGSNRTERYQQGRNTNMANAQRLAEFMNYFGADTAEQIAAKVDRMLQARVNNRRIEQVYVEDGREVVKQVLAEAPHDILLGFMQKRLVKVALAFGFTLPALTQAAKASASGNSDVRKAGGRGKEEDGSNSLYFENSMRALKTKMLGLVREMFLFINGKAFFRQKIEDFQESKKGTKQKDDDDDDDGDDFDWGLGVEVSFPGHPDDKKLRELFLDSLLKPDHYVRYMSSYLGVPLEAFQKPKLTIQELNGIQEPEPQQDENTVTTVKKKTQGRDADGGTKKAEETTTTTTTKAAAK